MSEKYAHQNIQSLITDITKLSFEETVYCNQIVTN